MKELVDQALFAPTLPLTIILAALTLYWIAASLGFSFGEDDVADDLETDGPFGSLLSFLNIGEVPLMIVLTVLTLSTWVISMLANYFVAAGSVALGFAFLIPALLAGAVVTRFTTMPFKRVLRLLNSEGDAPMQIVGRVAIVTTATVTARYGQAEIQTDGAPVIVQIRAAEGEVLSRGDSALLVSENGASGIFTVKKVSNEQLEN